MTKTPAREAAETIAATLRQCGFTALLAGGCVRDLLLGLSPKDYDVATDATPDDVIRLFRRTEKVGAKFGVVIVRLKGVQVEVATFRSDLEYTDGRRPDAVRFASPEEDAQRRDFTVNGMFLDPADGRLIDLVGGREDLRARLIRAIGEPEQRFSEDHLRMLRAVRFAAALDFDIEPATLAAIRHHAAEIRTISAERIQQELARILGPATRKRGWDLLVETVLIDHVFPGLSWPPDSLSESANRLAALPPESDFVTALAAVLVHIGPEEAARVCRELRCSAFVERAVAWLIHHLPRVLGAPIFRTPHGSGGPGAPQRSGAPVIAEALELADIKLLMADRRFPRLMQLASAEAEGVSNRQQAYAVFAGRAAAIPKEKVAPPPLITGADLQAMNIPPGPIYGKVLEAVYRAQLGETLTTRDEGLRMAQELVRRELPLSSGQC